MDAVQLVQMHHEEQKLIARNTVAELRLPWTLLDFHDLQGSTGDWLKAARPIVEKGYLVSQYVAAEFARTYRRALVSDDWEPPRLPNPLGVFTPAQAPRDIQLRIMVSLKVTGPVHVGHIMPMHENEAMEAGFSKSTGAATRLVLNGGRGYIRTLADADSEAMGVVGVADETSCDSCQFLTNPIFKHHGGRRMDAVAVGHDYCKCSAHLLY
jgi:hypothetical protein